MKKKTAIVTGGTANDVPAMACLVMNIKDTNPNLADEIVILHDGISEKDQRLINNIFPTRFIFYESPFKTVKEFGSVVTNYFSLMVFCKYECFKLLEDYEKVIWTDYDVIILDDLSELKEKSPSSIEIMISTSSHIYNAFKGNYSNLNFLKKYDLEREGLCMSLFVLYDNLTDYKDLYAWSIEYTKRLAQYLFFPEQAVINLLLQEFDIKAGIRRIIDKIYSVHPSNFNKNSDVKILHAYGQPKFWNGLYNETWEKNYTQWIKMGGSPYEHRTMKYKLKTIKQNFKSTVKKAIKKLIRKI
ncbi:glycosyltransferase [Treponema lecithinolyticum]